MRAGRLPQNLLILLYKIKNNEVSLNMVNGGGGGNRTRYTKLSVNSLNNKIILVFKKHYWDRYNGTDF